jgi:hypothetical protein
MSFKWPSTNWQEPAGFKKVNSDRPIQNIYCSVCGSQHDLGVVELHFSNETFYLCQKHHLCTELGIRTIASCREQSRKITMTEFEAGRWNSYDRDAMVPYYEMDLLLSNIEYCMKNWSGIKYPSSTYDEAARLYLQELYNRTRQSIYGNKVESHESQDALIDPA